MAKNGKARKPTASAPTVVDLFCGAGGLSLGFERAGFRSLLAIDHFECAVETFRANLGDHVEHREIAIDMELPQVDVIAGGPPCQGFSSAGMRRLGDHRNTLVTVFAELIARHRPKMFVFENVEGFLTGENGDRVLDLLGPVVEAGYMVHLRKVNVANYGVAQHRKRVIALGGLGWDPGFPEPTHRAHGAPGAKNVAGGLPPTLTLADVLAGLPPATLAPPGVPQGHFAVPIAEVDLARIHALKPGQTMRDLPEELWHDSFKRRAFRRVQDGTPTEKRGGAPAGVRRLKANEPSKAITSFARNEFIHPRLDRFLTIRECARIQSFPDDFEFVGKTADQALQIGNAVPPAFATAIAKHVRQALRGAFVRNGRGSLLSFVPTMSTGMSPALRSITDRVVAKFQPRLSSQEQLQLWA